VIVLGVDATRSLVICLVVLSFGFPVALIPLVLFTRRRQLLGSRVNRRITTFAASAVAVVIVSLNLFLLEQTFFG
jgi:manganese transport protein